MFAHPQNETGVNTVIAAGVDVLAHTAPGPSGYTPEQLAHFKSQGTALIPTLSLFTTDVLGPALTARMVASASTSSSNFRKMEASFSLELTSGSPSSMTPRPNTNSCTGLFRRRQVLASLTTNPALYFKAAKKGRVENGI